MRNRHGRGPPPHSAPHLITAPGSACSAPSACSVQLRKAEGRVPLGLPMRNPPDQGHAAPLAPLSWVILKTMRYHYAPMRKPANRAWSCPVV